MGTNRPWNWRLSVAKMIKMRLIRPLMTYLDDCVVSACSPLPPSIKALTLNWSRLLDRGPPCCSPWLLASKIKQTFLLTNLASLLAFEWWAAGPHPYQPPHFQENKKDQLAQSYKASKSLDPGLWTPDHVIFTTLSAFHRRGLIPELLHSSHISVSPTLSEGWEKWFVYCSCILEGSLRFIY